MDAYLCNFVHLSHVHSSSSKPLFQTGQFGIHTFPQFLIFNIIQYNEVSKFPGFTLAMWSHLIDSEYFPTEPCLSGDLLGTFCRGEGIDVFTNNLFKILGGSRLIIKHWKTCRKCAKAQRLMQHLVLKEMLAISCKFNALMTLDDWNKLLDYSPRTCYVFNHHTYNCTALPQVYQHMKRQMEVISPNDRSFPYPSIYASTLKSGPSQSKVWVGNFHSLTQNVKSATSTNPSQDSSWLSPAVSWMGRGYMSEKNIRQK